MEMIPPCLDLGARSDGCPGASRFLFLLRPWLESAFQFAGLLNLGLTPKSDGFTLQKFDARAGDLPRPNPELQGCSRNLRHPGDLNCRVKLWTHDSNPITERCHLSTNGFSLSITERCGDVRKFAYV